MRFSPILLLAAGLLADEPRLVVESGGHQAVIKFLAFTHDGKYVVSAGRDKVIRIWDIASQATVRTIRGQSGDGMEGMIFAAALSPEDRYLAVGGWLHSDSNKETIRIHDFSTGEVVALLEGHTNTVHSLAFSKDGRYLASGSGDHTIRIWEVSTWRTAQVLAGHQGDVYALSFSADGRRILSGSFDKTLGIWDVTSGKLLKQMAGHREEVTSAVFSPDDRYIVSGSADRTVRLWNGRTGDFVKELADQTTVVTALAFSPDGRFVFSGSLDEERSRCRLFEIPSGRAVSSLCGQGNIVATSFSPDGKLIATASTDDNQINVWTPVRGSFVRGFVGMGQTIWSVGFAADGKSIAFGNSSQQVTENNRGPLRRTFWLAAGQGHEVGLGEPVAEEKQYLRAEEEADDVSLRLKRGEIQFTNSLQILRGGQIVHEITRDVKSGGRHTAFSLSPDKTMIASGGDSGFLTLYNAGDGQRTASCVGHTSEVWSVAFSPDSNMLVSGSGDQTVRLWDVSRSACRNLLTIFVSRDGEWVAWTPQGYYTSSAKGDKYVGWQVNQGPNRQAKFYTAARFQKQFYRPDVIAELLNSRNIETATRVANERRGGEVRAEPVLGSSDVLASLPPMISISSPEGNEITVDQRTFRIRAEVLSNTLPIADVKVLLNGVQVAGRGKAAGSGSTKRRLIDLEVELEEGPNTVSIMASNEKAMSEPETRKIVCRPAASAGAQKPALIALAIGISKYARPEIGLKYGDADATAFQSILQSQADPDHILFRDVKVHVLPNEKATRGGIVREMDWLSREGTQRDLRILFLSGHGDVDSQNNYFFFSHEHDPDDYDLYDVPWDLLIRKLTSVEGRAVLFVDTCHAGAVSGNARKSGGKPLSQIIKEMETHELGMVVFAASTGSQISVELDRFQHGAFTEALYEGLGEGKADLNHDGLIETEELGTWLSQRVRDLTEGKQAVVYEPTPGLPSFPIFRVKK